MEHYIYLDNAATTPISQPVLDAMLPWLQEGYGNPSSIYRLGQQAQMALEESRQKVAVALGAKPQEIFFTSGGSEADNWAIKSLVRQSRLKGRHIITSAFEHHAVLHSMAALEEEGFDVTYLPVNENGVIRPEQLKSALRDDTVFVSIMLANNEIGTIQPIRELAAISHQAGVPFHTDAVQAVGHIPVDVQELGVDLLSLSGHKFHGPKGVGALYIRQGLRLQPYLSGGAQEKGRRAGTENVAAIVGMAKALELAVAALPSSMLRLSALRDKLIDQVLAQIPYCRLNGDRQLRLPGNANFSFQYVEGEGILLFLDSYGIAASSGSACTSGSLDPSHVLLAIGLPHEIAHGSLRISLGDQNSEQDVDKLLQVLPSIIQRLRDMSPLYENLA